MDFAVNSGVSRAVIFLQEIVGVAPDGKIGPLTLEAIHKWDSVKLIEKLCANRLAFLKRLSTWPTFGKGWSRRVSEVLHLAKDMAIALPSPPTTPVPPVSTPAPSLWQRFTNWLHATFRKD
jgi:lysozyme family protein